MATWTNITESVMTNYNDGKWHGWNGGECPVHADSLIETRHKLTGPVGDSTYMSSTENNTASAGWFNRGCWLHNNFNPESPDGDNPIIAFRVVKGSKSPREFWIDQRTGHASKYRPIHSEYIHVKEVLP